MEPSLIFYAIFGLFLGVSLWGAYRGRRMQGVKHLAAWGGIALFFVFLYSFKDGFISVKNRIYGQLFPASAVTRADGAIELRKSADGHFHLDAEINGYGKRFLIDTGATGIVISPATAEKAGIDTERLAFNRRIITANGAVFAAVTKADIKAGPFMFYDIPVMISSGKGDTNVLGMRFLSLFKTYSVSGDRLVLAGHF